MASALEAGSREERRGTLELSLSFAGPACRVLTNQLEAMLASLETWLGRGPALPFSTTPVSGIECVPVWPHLLIRASSGTCSVSPHPLLLLEFSC